MLDQTISWISQAGGDRADCPTFRPKMEALDLFGKRAFDVTLSAILLVLSAPLFLLAMVLVKLTSRGPFIYSQVRLGRDRRTFTMYKIRTMAHDCERLTGPRWSTRDDPRVTPIGRLLRRTHLDELPQLWNVLRGEMSLVGPRPERPEIVRSLEIAIPRYADRLAVRPGLTGLAQVQLPPDVDQESVRRKLALDLRYIERANLWLDLRLMLCTGLSLVGVPFASSCRLLGLLVSTGAEPSRRARDREGADFVPSGTLSASRDS
ncbi:MAG TPA: sugar transferase [Isosphaeraceae bacterium]|jgi:lipopolysaccharide/colanic/teichoic acid biosynthesis glycosyltransferase|nr:sugar transferase [Isosphaeraceae bacterium]